MPSVGDVVAPADLFDDREPRAWSSRFPLADSVPVTQNAKLPSKPGAR
jgi:hypothetical protein